MFDFFAFFKKRRETRVCEFKQAVVSEIERICSETSSMMSASLTERLDLMGASSKEHANLMNASLTEHINLMGASLTEHVKLMSASLTERLDLMGVSSKEHANLMGASLSEHINLMGASLTEHVNLMGASLTERLDLMSASSKEHANLMDASLTEHVNLMGESLTERLDLMSSSWEERLTSMEGQMQQNLRHGRRQQAAMESLFENQNKILEILERPLPTTVEMLMSLAENFALSHPISFADSYGVSESAILRRKLADLLACFELTLVAETGVPFDPEKHEACGTDCNPDYPENSVLEVVLPGFLLKVKVHKYATVIVNRREAPQAPTEREYEEEEC